MKAARYAATRQKSCLPCSAAKAKCDRKVGRCTRCALRGLSCTYPQRLIPGASANHTSNNGEGGLDNPSSRSNTLSTSGPLLSSLEHTLPTGEDNRSSIDESTQSKDDDSPTNTSATFAGGTIPIDSGLGITNHFSEDLEMPDFSSLELLSGQELFCPINADDISNRWLNSYIPVPGQKNKDYPASITALIHRILNSYVAVTIRGRGVPLFVHASQVTATSIRTPLSTCLTLVRMCERPLPGSESVASEVLRREMSSLYEQHGTYDDIALLATFQAYLIYSMVLFFRLSQGSSPFLRQAMMNLQDLACSSSRRGLMCTAEQQRSRPRWEAWIISEAKRRTLFTMYLFDSLLSAQDGLPTLLGTELEGLPAPANRLLWRAHTRREWETAYNTHLVDWVECFRIDELWPIPAHLDQLSILKRRSRVDQWLENVDEFGTMLYAVTSCTHGG